MPSVLCERPRTRTPRIHLVLAALYGYLAMPQECQAELSLYQSRTPLAVEDMVAVTSPRPHVRALLLDGIKLGREGLMAP